LEQRVRKDVIPREEGTGEETEEEELWEDR
jgi:hypothetical protein